MLFYYMFKNELLCAINFLTLYVRLCIRNIQLSKHSRTSFISSVSFSNSNDTFHFDQC